MNDLEGRRLLLKRIPSLLASNTILRVGRVGAPTAALLFEAACTPPPSEPQTKVLLDTPLRFFNPSDKEEKKKIGKFTTVRSGEYSIDLYNVVFYMIQPPRMPDGRTLRLSRPQSRNYIAIRSSNQEGAIEGILLVAEPVALSTNLFPAKAVEGVNMVCVVRPEGKSSQENLTHKERYVQPLVIVDQVNERVKLSQNGVAARLVKENEETRYVISIPQLTIEKEGEQITIYLKGEAIGSLFLPKTLFPFPDSLEQVVTVGSQIGGVRVDRIVARG